MDAIIQTLQSFIDKELHKRDALYIEGYILGVIESLKDVEKLREKRKVKNV